MFSRRNSTPATDHRRVVQIAPFAVGLAFLKSTIGDDVSAGCVSVCPAPLTADAPACLRRRPNRSTDRPYSQMLQEVVGRGERPARAFCELGWGGDREASR